MKKSERNTVFFFCDWVDYEQNRKWNYRMLTKLDFLYLGPEHVDVELGILKIGQLENEL